MKSLINLGLLLTFITLSLSGCASESSAEKHYDWYDKDEMVNARVVNRWLSGTKLVIQVVTAEPEATRQAMSNIEETYFPSITPQINDCVKVWALKRREINFSGFLGGGAKYTDRWYFDIIYSNRNIVPCTN